MSPNVCLYQAQRGSGENVYEDILGQGDFSYPEADIGLFVHLKPRNWSSDLCSSKNKSLWLSFNGS